MSFKVVSSTTRMGSTRSTGRVAPTMQADATSMNSISDIRRTKLTWEISYKSTRTFDPDSTKMQLWHTFLLTVVLYGTWVVPLLTCFGQLNPAICHESWLQVLVTLGEFFFLVDVYVQMHSRTYLHGDLVRDIKVIRRHYVTSRGFTLDIAALVPLAVFLPSPLHVCGLDLVNKLLRLRKVHAYTLTFDKVFARYYKLCKVVKAVAVVYFSCHFMACIYASFGKMEDPPTVEDAWKAHDFSKSGHRRRLSVVGDGRTELLLTEYFACLFWAMGLVCKCVEGQVPRTLLQTVFMLAVMFGGFLLFVYICGTLFMISKCDANRVEVFEAKLNQLKHILSYHQVPQDIQHRAVEYLENGFKSGDTSDRHTLNLLCPSIAQDIKFATLKAMVTTVPFFKLCRAAFIRALIDLMETQSVPTNYIVCRKGEVGEDMYFIQSGVVVVLVDGMKVRELRSGHYFGEQAVLINQIRNATVVASTYCNLQKLSRANVRKVMQGYPECESQIMACLATITADQRRTSKLIQQRSFTKSAVARGQVAASKEGSIMHGLVQRRMSKRFVGPIGDFAGLSNDQPPKRTLPGLYRCLLKTTISRTSKCRLVWLVLVMASNVYNIVAVPLVNAFDLVGYPTAVLVLNTMNDVILWLDIYGKFNLTYVHEAEHVDDPIKCAKHYYQTSFVVDVVSTFPLWIVSPSFHMPLRFFRLIRVARLHSDLEELGQFVRIDSRKRIILLGSGLVLCYHIAGCMAHSLTIHLAKMVDNSTGDLIGYDYLDGAKFVPLGDPFVRECILRQYTRALQYGAVCLTDLGHILEPETLGEFALALGLMLSGMLLVSLVIDDVQKCVTASAVEQLQFLTLRSRIMHFFSKEKVPHQVRRRVSEYMDFRWSAHRGANMNTLLGELPSTIRRDIYGFICAPVLDVIEAFDSIAPHHDRVCELLLDNIAVNLYAQGELLYNKGDFADALYVLLAGDVKLVSTSGASTALPQRYVKPGEIFGCSSLALEGDCNVHLENAVARAACVVALIPRGTLMAIEKEYPTFCHGLLKNEIKMLAEHRAMARLLDQAELAAMSQTKCRGTIDPDSTFLKVWDTLHFAVQVSQAVAIPYFLAFGYGAVGVDARNVYAVVVEVFFAVDAVLKARTGYYSFGNKVSDLKQIRRHYLHSVEFLWAVVAIVPLDLANFACRHQSEVWNLNKLARLATMSVHFEKLAHYVFTINIPIRVAKVVFFVYLLAHYTGCVWYGFASFVCTIWGADNGPFGKDEWLPGTDIALTDPGVSMTFKYTRAFYWGVGLLLGFCKGKIPHTSGEAVFPILVQTIGVFLLAYVVGNLLDIAQVMDGNNQSFYSNLNYVRKLTTYFDFTDDVKTKIQHFYFYRLSHSIHEEPVLTSSLPPNLVGDIRLFLLTPMLKNVPFFHGDLDNSIVTRLLVRYLTQVLVTRHEIVCRQGDVGTDMYFVFVGCLNVLVTHTHNDMPAHSSITYETSQLGTNVTELHAGSFFGERALFTDQPRTATIQAKTFCTLYKLTRTHLEAEFAHYPQWKNNVVQVVHEYYERRQRNAGPVRSKEEPSHSQVSAESTKAQHGGCQHVEHITQNVVACGLGNIVTAVTEIKLQSPLHRAYLQLMRCTLLYIAMREPYLVAFGSAASPSAATALVQGLDIAASIVFAFDIWFKRHIVETPESFEFYDRIPRPSRLGLVLDIIVLLPFDHALASVAANDGAPLRLLRLVKLRQLNHVYRDLQRFSMAHELNMIKLLALYYFVTCYWTACAYYALASTIGFSDVWESSVPVVYFQSPDASGTFDLLFAVHQFSRCLYFSVCMYTGVGMAYEPTVQLQYVFNCVVHVFGIFVMGYVIGEGSTLCIYVIQNEVDFKVNQMHVMEFLARKHLDSHLRTRIHNYLSYWWSFQGGVNYQAILDQLPQRIRGHAMFEISRRSLSRFSVRYVRPVVQQRGIDAIIHKLVRRLVFQGVPAGETVIVQGNIGHTMYFVSSGTIMTVSTVPNFTPSRFDEGQFVGDEGLMATAVRQYSAVTLRASDLLALTAEDFLAAMNESPRTAECCRVAWGVVKLQTSSKHRSSHYKGSLDRMICDSMAPMSRTLQTLTPMTPEVAEIMLGHFVKLFLPPPCAADAGGSTTPATVMCHNCESVVSDVYCKECRQSLCAKCSSLMHDNSHISFHAPGVTKLTLAVNTNPPSTLAAKTIPRLRRFVAAMKFRRGRSRAVGRPQTISVTGLDTSSSFLSVTHRSITAKPLQSQPENKALTPEASRSRDTISDGHVARVEATPTGCVDGSLRFSKAEASQLSRLTHTNSASTFRDDPTPQSRSTATLCGKPKQQYHRSTAVGSTRIMGRKSYQIRPHLQGLKASHSTPKITFHPATNDLLDTSANAANGLNDIASSANANAATLSSASLRSGYDCASTKLSMLEEQTSSRDATVDSKSSLHSSLGSKRTWNSMVDSKDHDGQLGSQCTKLV